MTNITKLQESFKQIEDILQNLDLREYSYYQSQELLSNLEEIKTVVITTEIANKNKEQPQPSQHAPQTLAEDFEID